MKNSKIQEEIKKIKKLSKMSILSYVLFIILLLLSFYLKYGLKIPETKLLPVYILLGISFIYGLIMQYLIKCPYCGYRIIKSTSLGIPSKCPKCKKDLI